MSRAVLTPMVAMIVALLVLSTVGSVAATGDDLPSREQAAFQAAVDRVAPSVVRIETVGGRERLGERLLGDGPTTGLIISPDGLIVSSSLNFLARPDSILVQLSDGIRRPARLVATDHSRMIVLLAIDTDTPLAVPEMAPRDRMRVGQWAIGVGRTFEGNRPNVSVGILSALSRLGGRALQTDAATSPNNYGGPLLDIHGRVLGLLAPLSPERDEEAGRTEWYDSGVGFAVAADDILRVLPRLRQGEDLHAGRLGVSFGRSEPNTAEPIVAATHPNAPARKVLKPGDRITAAGGVPVARVAELENVLGRYYAGDKVVLDVERDGKPLHEELTLVAELPPYDRPFLGILPRRDGTASSGGVRVRYVFPGSPASKAHIEPGDVLLALGGKQLAGADDLGRQIALLKPGDEVTLDLSRGGTNLSVSARLGRLPEDLPNETLPPAHGGKTAKTANRPPRGKVNVAVPEIKNKAWVYVPKDYDARFPCGVVVWLDSPGAVDDDAILKLWKPACDRRNLILLVVNPMAAAAWLPNEESVVARMLDEVIGQYAVDSNRIVVHGYQGGGTLACLVAFRHRDLVRAVAAVDAPLPGHAPSADPISPLAFYVVTAKKSPNAARIARAIKALRKARHPVDEQSLGELPRCLSRGEVDRLAKWIDTLDRI
ncbi:MAG: PDZ domain-containing protein [Pirellulales bacterium]|nr:PDZ domain-containing protein [Pirellulales bacterium]